MNLYIISSPLQLTCGIESWLINKSESVFWVFLGKSEKANSFMLKICDEYLSEVQVQYTYSSSPVKLLIEKIKKIKFFQKKYQFENIYIGNISEFSEKLCAINIKSKKLWSLDDGAKTLVLNDFHTKQNNKIKCFDNNSAKNLIKYLVIKFFLLRTSREIVVNWFTIFDFKPKNEGEIQIHKLDNFKKKINYSGQYAINNDDEVYFIGTNLINAGVMNSKENYFKLMKEIKLYYHNKKITYITHRHESDSDINIIKNIGFEIKEFDNIIEIAFLEMDIYPTTIASFYSTALYSLSKLFPKATVNFFKLNQDFITPKFTSNLTIVEKEYESMFGITKLNKI